MQPSEQQSFSEFLEQALIYYWAGAVHPAWLGGDARNPWCRRDGQGNELRRSMSPNPITDAIGLIIILIMAGGLIGLSIFGCLLGAISDFSTGRKSKKSTPHTGKQ